MPKFEIIKRGSGEHLGPENDRLGYNSIHIDGVDAEYLNDPTSFFPSCLHDALTEGCSAEEAPKRALVLAEERSVHCLNRVIERIRQGKMDVGGIPIGESGLEPNPFTTPMRGTAKEAAHSFLHRGKLKGLDNNQRKQRRAEQDRRTDHTADWIERRKNLIQSRESDLAAAKKQFALKKDYDLEKRIKFLEQELAGLYVGVVAATHGFQFTYGQYLQKQIDLVNDTIKIVACMTNTTVNTERDAKTTISAFTTLDEFDGSGWTAGGQTLANKAVNIDDSNDRAAFDADDSSATLGAGTRSIKGNLLMKFVSTLANSIPLHWLEYAVSKTPDGSVFTVVFNSSGILLAQDG